MASIFKRNDSPNWYAEWFNHSGQRMTRSTRTTDKRAAERIAGKWEADAALRRENVIDPRMEALAAQGELPIEHHLQNFRASLDSANRTVKHIDHVIGVIRKIAVAAGLVCIRDISADAVNRFASELRKNRSTRTVQSQLGAFKQFTSWLARTHKLPFDPLSSICLPNPNSDRKRLRRMLLPEEWLWLQSVTESRPVGFGMTGHERVVLYDLAIQTGLRAAELRSLRRSNFHLDSDQPFVICHARSTKNRKACRQYIRPELAELLRNLLPQKSPGDAAFSLPTKWRMADMIRADVQIARQAYLDAAKGDSAELNRRQSDQFLELSTEFGEFDFHSLRHTCGAWLAQTGAHPKAIQTVMRHSTITLTMDQYGHLFPDEQARLVDRLGSLFRGLDAARLPGDLQYALQQSQHDSTLQDATPCDSSGPAGPSAAESKYQTVANLCEPVRPAAGECESTPEWIRTTDRRIRNPLLYPAELRAQSVVFKCVAEFLGWQYSVLVHLEVHPGAFSLLDRTPSWPNQRDRNPTSRTRNFRSSRTPWDSGRKRFEDALITSDPGETRMVRLRSIVGRWTTCKPEGYRGTDQRTARVCGTCATRSSPARLTDSRPANCHSGLSRITSGRRTP